MAFVANADGTERIAVALNKGGQDLVGDTMKRLAAQNGWIYKNDFSRARRQTDHAETVLFNYVSSDATPLGFTANVIGVSHVAGPCTDICQPFFAGKEIVIGSFH